MTTPTDGPGVPDALDDLGVLLSGFDRAWSLDTLGLAADGRTRSGLRRISGLDVRERLAELVGSEYPKLVAVAQKRMRASREDAEDVVQQTLLKLWRTPPRMREPDKLRSFVYTSLYNQTSTWFASTATERGRRAPDRGDDGPPDVADPAPAFENLVVHHMVVSLAMATLPPREAELVELFYVERLPLAEAAERLRISVGAAKRYLHDARLRLREDPGIASLTRAA